MIPVAKPFLNSEEIDAVKDVILSGWVTQGPKVKEFEEAFAHYVSSKHACATSSCTTALHLALLASGVRPGDVVITVSHSFIATANAVRYCGAEPVLIDIDPDNYNMSAEKLELFFDQECEQRPDGLYFQNVSRLLTEESPFNHIEQHLGRVGALLVVHQMGMPCNLKDIIPIAKAHGLPVIEDAACAIGSEVSMDDGKTFERIGRPHGDVACFSFHPRKVMTTGEGGMITTNDAKIDQQARLLRHQGMDVSDVDRHAAKEIQFEQYTTTAYNYRMTDIQAAIGIEQLKKMPGIIKRRREVAMAYQKQLADIEYIKLPQDSESTRTNWQSFPVRILKDSPKSRDEIMQFLLNNEIATRQGIMNIHMELPYQNKIWHLPETESARSEVIILPLYQTLSDKGIEFIIEQLRLAVS